MLNYRTKNYLLFFALLLVSSTVFSQKNRPVVQERYVSAGKKTGAFIDVNAPSYPESSYTPSQMVSNVLITSGTTCAPPNVSNVTVSPNHSATDASRFWGFFHKGTTNFPFEKGMVLTTGVASSAGNTEQTGTLSGMIGWGQTDSDLAAATGVTQNLNDAVSLEFDFIPYSSTVQFNYIFASEEYTGSYPCSFSDAFALLIKPVGGAYTNLAVLPAGAGAVSVTNIHPANQDNGNALTCGASNASYFGGYNPAATAGAVTETNYNGRTIPLTAIANVTPGVTYHFKMVLADAGDQAFDSAVFLEGGSFDLGIVMVDETGAELPSTITKCEGASVALSAQVTNIPGMTVQWYRNGVAIPGATSLTYNAVLPGVYEVRIWLQGSTCPLTATVTVVDVAGITSPLKGGLVCSGDRITLDAGSGTNYSYLWSNGATTQTISVGESGTYSVTITNGTCTSTFSTVVKKVSPVTVTSINYADNNLEVNINNTSGEAVEYSFDNGLTWQNSNILLNVTKNTVYKIRIRIKTTTCETYIEYFTFDMQNVITPNGDNVNDIIDFRGVSQNNKFSANVSDRYGKVVYKYETIRPYWDGYFQAKKLPTSSYWYQVSFEDPATKQMVLKTGWILLKNFE